MARRRTRHPATEPFDETDYLLLGLIEAQNLTLRATLCALARRGVAFREHDPERTRRWIEELIPHPLFKGGQFLFDLLEWDDFMLDGEPPPLFDPSYLVPILNRFASGLGLEIEPESLREAIMNVSPGQDLHPSSRDSTSIGTWFSGFCRRLAQLPPLFR